MFHFTFSLSTAPFNRTFPFQPRLSTVPFPFNHQTVFSRMCVCVILYDIRTHPYGTGRKIGSCEYEDLCQEFKPRTIGACPPPLGPAGIPCACPIPPGDYSLPPTAGLRGGRCSRPNAIRPVAALKGNLGSFKWLKVF